MNHPNKIKYLIVPNSFKDCLPAIKVGEAIRRGILLNNPESEIKVLPIADGGPGTIEAILSRFEGSLIHVNVLDPLLRPIEGYFAIIDGKTAIIEMSIVNGIERLPAIERNPWYTSSFGTGQLIKHALDLGCQKIFVGLGGSATNDGGIGMASALGVRIFDQYQKIVTPVGGNLHKINSIDFSDLDKRLSNTSIQVITDVENPFFGKEGATLIFGSQKGADLETVEKLEKGMMHFALLLEKEFQVPVNSIIGGGAAGGLGAAFKLILGAEIFSGIKFLADKLQLENEIENADIVISAEGAFDFQSLYGKAPVGLAKIAQKHHKPFFIFTGNVPSNIDYRNSHGITTVIPITKRPVSLDDAIANAPDWLEDAGRMFSTVIDCGKGLII